MSTSLKLESINNTLHVRDGEQLHETTVTHSQFCQLYGMKGIKLAEWRIIRLPGATTAFQALHDRVAKGLYLEVK